jgi:exodeoxyribonuclease VIII
MSDDRSDYDLIEAVNYSTLKQLWAMSPKHYRHTLQYGRKESPALTNGTLVHTAVLEPHLLDRRYLVRPPGLDMRTKAGKEWLAEHAESGRTIVTEEQYANALAIGEAVRRHPYARELLAAGVAETTVVWNDEETGERLKGRIDWLTPGHIVDLKTTAKIKPRDFQAQAARLGYPMQFALYSDGVAATLGARGFFVIAVESAPPFDVVVYSIPEDVIEQGREDYREALHTLIRCRELREWPGVAGVAPIEFRLPAWAVESDEDDLGDLDWGDST